MTIEIIENEIKKVEYPYLGKADDPGVIVLFLSPGCGVSLKKDIKGITEIEYSEVWAESDFTPLQNGFKIILSNE